jgi:hypothetical protein
MLAIESVIGLENASEIKLFHINLSKREEIGKPLLI